LVRDERCGMIQRIEIKTRCSGELYQGHVIEVLKTLSDNSVDCVVTSPPYWGLRDYKIEPQVWDSVDDHFGPCEHEWGEENTITQTPQSDSPGGFHNSKSRGEQTNTKGKAFTASQGSFCLHCGAWRGSLGLEPTPELFVKHIVQVFREVRRVMKPTGVRFVNLGDSYASTGRSNRKESPGVGAKQEMTAPGRSLVWKSGGGSNFSWTLPGGQKPKDLCGVPWRVAFALQADGWWLRSDIIWAKPNPMPESVTDRPTKSHEYIFLLTKSAKYFWNQEAVREGGKNDDLVTWADRKAKGEPMRRGLKDTSFGSDPHLGTNPNGRNIRSVWTFATEPTPEAHFATFPQELVKRCILAGTSEKGCCPKCGKPWEPVVENEVIGRRDFDGIDRGTDKRGIRLRCGDPEKRTTGWRPTCSCGEEKTVPAVVLDCFGGTGTTAVVAENMFRRWIIIELNSEYIKMIKVLLGKIYVLGKKYSRSFLSRKLTKEGGFFD